MKTIPVILLLVGFFVFIGLSDVNAQVNTEEEETVVEPAVQPPATEKPNTTKSEPVPGAEVYMEEGTSGIEPAAGNNNKPKTNTKTNTTGKKEEEEKPDKK